MSELTPQATPLLVDPREAARLLGISPRLLWTMTARGDVPCVRAGRLVRYRPETLREWTEQNESAGRRR
ncbi:MAG: helix-turn-helix domain-containing protein [Phycisphaeraceae bacterium]